MVGLPPGAGFPPAELHDLARPHRYTVPETPYEVVPGVSSATAAAAAAALQVELTVPEVTQTVILTRRGGRTPVPAKESLEQLAALGASMCIFLSVGMIETVVAELLAGGYGPQAPVAVVEKASWPEQRLVRGTLATIAEQVRGAEISKPAMILVGEALAAELAPASKLYAPDFSHSYRERPA